MWLRIVFLSVLLVCALHAANIKLNSLTVGSRVYSNVTVLGVNETDVYIRHNGGLSNLKLKYLSPELQRMFHYDPERAAEIEQQQVADEKEFQASLVQNIEADVQRRMPKDELPAALVLADAASDRSLINKKAPALNVEKWLTETPSTEGKFVIVCFWETTSTLSRRYISELNNYQKRFKDRLVVIGLSSQTEDQIADMIEPKIEFAHGIDPEHRLADAVDATSVPYIVFIDPKGLIRYYGHPAAINERVLQAFFSHYAGE